MAIIKCPECNREISDLAPQCPYCGVEIANNITTCPDCGKVVLKREKNCPNCGCAIEQSQAEATKRRRSSNYRNYPEYSEPRPRRQKSHTTLWVVFTIFLIAGLGIGGFFIYQYETSRQKMELAYKALSKDNQLEHFEQFLNNYPQSPYTKDVVERLDILKDIKKKWEEVAQSSQRSDFQKFQEQFPNSAFEEDCNQKIDSIDWIDATMDNTAASYQRYIKQHPDGVYLSQAKLSKENIDKMTVGNSEKYGVRNIMYRYFDAVGANNRDEIATITLERMFKETMDFTNKLHTDFKNVYFSFQNYISVSKAPNPNTDYVFIAKGKLERVTITHSGVSLTKNYAVTASLTPDMKIISVKIIPQD